MLSTALSLLRPSLSAAVRHSQHVRNFNVAHPLAISVNGIGNTALHPLPTPAPSPLQERSFASITRLPKSHHSSSAVPSAPLTEGPISSLQSRYKLNKIAQTPEPVAHTASAVSAAVSSAVTGTPLATFPTPPNNDVTRAMFVYTTPAFNDPLATPTEQQNLVNFCGAYNVNQLYLDIYPYLGAPNNTPTKRATMRNFVGLAAASGINVVAYSGDVNWGTNQSYVKRTITLPMQQYQESSAEIERFSGFIFDVEYWTDPTYNNAANCRGLCALMNSMRKTLDFSVGCFATFWLKDSTGARASFPFQGKTAQDGEFLVDNSDFVVVGAYRNTAYDSGGNSGQIPLFNPWYFYANSTTNGAQQARSTNLILGAETQNLSPTSMTYYGLTKTYMESQLAIESNFYNTNNLTSWYQGIAIDEYRSYQAMLP